MNGHSYICTYDHCVITRRKNRMAQTPNLYPSQLRSFETLTEKQMAKEDWVEALYQCEINIAFQVERMEQVEAALKALEMDE